MKVYKVLRKQTWHASEWIQIPRSQNLNIKRFQYQLSTSLRLVIFGRQLGKYFVSNLNFMMEDFWWRCWWYYSMVHSFPSDCLSFIGFSTSKSYVINRRLVLIIISDNACPTLCLWSVTTHASTEKLPSLKFI